MPARVLVSKHPRPVAATAKVRLRLNDFQRFARLKWPESTDEHKALAIGVDPATYSRITNGRQAAGAHFIARLLVTFEADEIGFDELFEVVEDEAVAGSVPA